MVDFATLDELKARLDWTLDADEERVAASALEDASDLARAHAGRDWPEAASAPRLARTLVLKACKRYMNNPAGYVQSRAGDETIGWSDDAGENAGTVYFAAEEIKLLEELGGKRGGLSSVEITAWNTRKRPAAVGLVPVQGGGDMFPLFAHEEEPW